MGCIIKHYEVTIVGRSGPNGGGIFDTHYPKTKPVVEYGHVVIVEGLNRYSYNLADVKTWFQKVVHEDN